MYFLMIVEYIMRIVLGNLKSIEVDSTLPGAVANLIVVPLASIMLILSLRGSNRDTE